MNSKYLRRFTKRDMPKNKKRFKEPTTRKGALSLARRRLERAYGIKGKSNFSPEELDELRQIFEFYDIDSSKTMDMSELNMALRALGYKVSEGEVAELASLMDVDGDMSMDFSEFCMIVEYLKEEKGLEDELRDAFRCIDTNGDGYVTADELLDLLMTQGNTMSLKEASELIRFVDRNNDGRLDYEEFMKIILENRNLSRTSTFFSSESMSFHSTRSRSSTSIDKPRALVKQNSMDEFSSTYPKTASTKLKLDENDVIPEEEATSSDSRVPALGADETVSQEENKDAEEKKEERNMEPILVAKEKDSIPMINFETCKTPDSSKNEGASIDVVIPGGDEVIGSVVLETRT